MTNSPKFSIYYPYKLRLLILSINQSNFTSVNFITSSKIFSSSSDIFSFSKLFSSEKISRSIIFSLVRSLLLQSTCEKSSLLCPDRFKSFTKRQQDQLSKHISDFTKEESNNEGRIINPPDAMNN
jgi:hypothetical protein